MASKVSRIRVPPRARRGNSEHNPEIDVVAPFMDKNGQTTTRAPQECLPGQNDNGCGECDNVVHGMHYVLGVEHLASRESASQQRIATDFVA
ncbi:hypothetical protein GCM10007857_78630 [Bradyrhizobium iriomotense]|uniref:Uncharacterized protein n=1 Tax=Bradyrhizobium iriomotense TaxID=441950 RepID=A0ABQ6B9T1_9BRAD|nr:hypothetical protein GCM10007857_78630 [Bradyrhizobium iriomotense]